MGWEGVGDWTELQYIDSHSYGHQRCVFLVLLGYSTGGLGAQPLWDMFSFQHLVVNSSGLQLSGGPEHPFCLVVAFSTTSSLQSTWSPTHWLPVFTELYNSSIFHSISLEWHVWSSSSRNNCHAVHYLPGHQSMSVPWDFYLVPYSQPNLPMRFLLITAIRMSHFLLVHHFGMACLAGSTVNIQH